MSLPGFQSEANCLAPSSEANPRPTTFQNEAKRLEPSGGPQPQQQGPPRSTFQNEANRLGIPIAPRKAVAA
jgi:hypothetical protein